MSDPRLLKLLTYQTPVYESFCSHTPFLDLIALSQTSRSFRKLILTNTFTFRTLDLSLRPPDISAAPGQYSFPSQQRREIFENKKSWVSPAKRWTDAEIARGLRGDVGMLLIDKTHSILTTISALFELSKVDQLSWRVQTLIIDGWDLGEGMLWTRGYRLLELVMVWVARDLEIFSARNFRGLVPHTFCVINQSGRCVTRLVEQFLRWMLRLKKVQVRKMTQNFKMRLVFVLTGYYTVLVFRNRSQQRRSHQN
jgi:hypothetical protein